MEYDLIHGSPKWSDGSAHENAYRRVELALCIMSTQLHELSKDPKVFYVVNTKRRLHRYV